MVEFVDVFDRFSEQLGRKFSGHLGRQFAAGFQQWIRLRSVIFVIVGGRPGSTCRLGLLNALGVSLLLNAPFDLGQWFLGEEAERSDGRSRWRYDESCLHRCWLSCWRRRGESSAHLSDTSRLLTLLLLLLLPLMMTMIMLNHIHLSHDINWHSQW